MKAVDANKSNEDRPTKKWLHYHHFNVGTHRGHFLRERVGTEYPYLLNAWERRSHTSREKFKKLDKNWESRPINFSIVNL